MTEVGLIPTDWEVKKIGEFTDACAGGTPSTNVSSFWNGDIRWMNSGELNLKTVYDVENRITELGLQNSATKFIPENCVLIGLAGQGKTRGTVAINKVPLCTNQSIAAIFPCKLVDYKYLYFNLDLRYNELRGLSTGDGGRGGLNLNIIKNLSIPIPTLAEQTAIATALSDADAYINSLESLIAKKQAIKQGAMQSLLSPKAEWEVRKLGEVADLNSGGTPLTGNTKYYNGGIPWVVIADISKAGKYISQTEKTISEEGLNNSSAKLFKKGTLLFAMYASIGKCAIAVMDGTCNQAILAIQTNSIETEYLYYFLALNETRFIKMGQTGTQSNLSKEIVSNLSISLPPLAEQARIATILSDMDADLAATEAQLSKARSLKQGMMQQLLTGKIRLPHS